jgi:hypothetical protein
MFRRYNSLVRRTKSTFSWKINEDSFALIYENNLDIAIFNIIDKDLILTRTVKVDSRVHCIKSLAAFSDKHFLLTNGSDCFSFMNDVDYILLFPEAIPRTLWRLRFHLSCSHSVFPFLSSHINRRSFSSAIKISSLFDKNSESWQPRALY